MAEVAFTGQIQLQSAGFFHRNTERWLALSTTYSNIGPPSYFRGRDVVKLQVLPTERSVGEIAAKIISYVLLFPFALIALLIRECSRGQYEFQMMSFESNNHIKKVGPTQPLTSATLDPLAQAASNAIRTRIEKDKAIYSSLSAVQSDILAKAKALEVRNKIKVDIDDNEINTVRLVEDPNCKRPYPNNTNILDYMDAVRVARTDARLRDPENQQFDVKLRELGNAIMAEYNTLTAYYKELDKITAFKEGHLISFKNRVNEEVARIPKPRDPFIF